MRSLAKVVVWAFLIILSPWVSTVDAASKPTGTYKNYEISYGKSKRQYHVYVPDIIKDMDKVSAVLAFHGPGMKPEQFHKMLSLEDEASDYAFIMVYPVGREYRWNAGRGPSIKKINWSDDETFALELIQRLIEKHKVDKNRIFAMGFSDGAQMATKLACNHADKIYAAASIAHSMNEWGCNPSHEISIMFVQGMKDPVVPYEGGTEFNYASHFESVDFFRVVNGITSAARTVKVNDSLKCRHYSNKKRSTWVIGCRLYDDGHQLPGAKAINEDKWGKANDSMDTAYFVLRRFYKLKAEKKPRDVTKIVSQGRINAGLKADGVQKLAEVRKTRRLKTLGTTAAQEATKLAAAKAAKKSAAKQKRATTPKPAPKPAPKSTPQIASAPKVPAPLASTSSQRVLSNLVQHKISVDGRNLDYSVLEPPMRSLRPEMRVALFVTPADVSASQMAGVVDAELHTLRYETLFVHVQSQGEIAIETLWSMMDLVNDLEARYGLDNPPVFAIGFSDGGELAQQIYCHQPAAFRGVVTIGYTWRKGDCHPMPQIPLLMMQSKQDNRFGFARVAAQRLPHEETVSQVLAHADTLTVKQPTLSKTDHRCHEWADLDGLSLLQSCTVDWGGNTIPGAKVNLDNKYGKVMNNFDAPRYLYEFMASFNDMPFSYGLYRHATPMVYH